MQNENSVIFVSGGPHRCQVESSQASLANNRKNSESLLAVEEDHSHIPEKITTGCRAAWQGPLAPHPRLPETNLKLAFSPVVPGLIYLQSKLLVLILLLGLILPIKIMSLHSNYQPSRAWVSLCLVGLSTAEQTSEAWYLLKPKLHTGTGVVAARRGRGVVVAITQSFVLPSLRVSCWMRPLRYPGEERRQFGSCCFSPKFCFSKWKNTQCRHILTDFRHQSPPSQTVPCS